MLDLPLIPWEGGPEYWSQFASMQGTEWETDTFFPIGAWGAYVDNASDWEAHADVGINTFWATFNSIANAETVATNNGIWCFGELDCGDRSLGWLIGDEMDMWCGGWAAGASCGWNSWNGQVGFGTQADGAQNGFTASAGLEALLPADGKLRYINWGKGIAYGHGLTCRRTFLGGNTYPYDGNGAHDQWPLHVASCDVYFYGDDFVVGEKAWFDVTSDAEVPRAANYGEVTMTRLRESSDYTDTNTPRIPLGAALELGGIFNNPTDLPTVDVIEGAAWSTLIFEARFLIYFTHAYTPGFDDYFSDKIARGTGTYWDNVRTVISRINSHVTALAPVLNTQSYEFTFNAGLNTMLKAKDGYAYIFAMQKRAATTSGDFTLDLNGSGINGTTAEVLNESRSISISGGQFTDNFAQEYTHHIYKIAI